MPKHVTVSDLTSTKYDSITVSTLNTADDGFAAGVRAVDSRRTKPFGTNNETTMGTMMFGENLYAYSSGPQIIASSSDGYSWRLGPSNGAAVLLRGEIEMLIGPSGTIFAMERNCGTAATFAEFGIDGAVLPNRSQIYYQASGFFGVDPEAVVVSGSSIIIGGLMNAPYVGPTRVLIYSHDNLASTGQNASVVAAAVVTPGDDFFFTKAVVHNGQPMLLSWDGTVGSGSVMHGVEFPGTPTRYPIQASVVPYDAVSDSGTLYIIGYNTGTMVAYAATSADGQTFVTSTMVADFPAKKLVKHSGSWWAFGYNAALSSTVYSTSSDFATWSATGSLPELDFAIRGAHSHSGSLCVIAADSRVARLVTGSWTLPMTKAALVLNADDGTHISSTLMVHQTLDVVGMTMMSGALEMAPYQGISLRGGVGPNVPDFSGAINQTTLGNSSLYVVGEWQSEVQLESFPWHKADIDFQTEELQGVSGTYDEAKGHARLRMRTGWENGYDHGWEVNVYGTQWTDDPGADKIVDVRTIPTTMSFRRGLEMTASMNLVGNISTKNGVNIRGPISYTLLSDWLDNPSITGTLTAFTSSAVPGTWYYLASGTTPPIVVTNSLDVLDPLSGNTATKLTFSASAGLYRNSVVQKIGGLIGGVDYSASLQIYATGTIQQIAILIVDSIDNVNATVIGGGAVASDNAWVPVTMSWTQPAGSSSYIEIGTSVANGQELMWTEGPVYIDELSIYGNTTGTQSVAIMSGAVEIKQVLNLSDYNNPSPTNGDVWLSGNNILVRLTGTTFKVQLAAYP